VARAPLGPRRIAVTVDSVQPVNPPRADQPDSPDVAVDGGGAGPGERAGGAPVVRPARRWSRRSGGLRVAGAHAGGRPVGRAGAVPRDPHPLLRQVPAAFVSAIGGAPRRPCGGRPGCARLPAGLAAPGPRCTRWTFPEVLNSKEAVIRTPGATPNCETAHGRRGSPEKRPGPRRSSPAHKAPTAPDRGLCRRAGAGAGGVPRGRLPGLGGSMRWRAPARRRPGRRHGPCARARSRTRRSRAPYRRPCQRPRGSHRR
jgi:hypothetical protein